MSEKPDYRQTVTLRLLRALVEAQRGIMEQAERRFEGYGLSGSEFDCLVTLGVDQPLRMCDLAQRSLLTKSHTTQVVKGLEKRGLVRRQRSPESDREVLASLTDEGQALFERVYPEHYRWLAERFRNRLNREEQERLAALLRKLADGQ